MEVLFMLKSIKKKWDSIQVYEQFWYMCPNCNNMSNFFGNEVFSTKCLDCNVEMTLVERKLVSSKEETIITQQTNNQPTVSCPYCKSINTKRINGTERVLSVATLGLFSNKINKSFKCNNCKGTF